MKWQSLGIFPSAYLIQSFYLFFFTAFMKIVPDKHARDMAERI